MQDRRMRRRGGGWAKLFLVLVLCGAALYGAAGVFTPWIFYTGGHFHQLPMWRGWGKIPSPDGNYWLYVWMAPKSSRGLYLTTWMRGTALLCTPRGERVPMRLTGSMARRLPMDVTGQWITLRVNYRPRLWGFTRAPLVPEIAMKGVWGKGEIQAAVSGLRDDTKSPRLQGLAKGIPVAFEETTDWLPRCPHGE